MVLGAPPEAAVADAAPWFVAAELWLADPPSASTEYD